MYNYTYFVLVGALCLAKHRKDKDRRLDDDFPTFKKYNRSLEYSCDNGPPAILEVTPNSSWPDIVYYNSFTHSNMGWKIHVVDNYNRSSVSAIQANIYLLLLFVFSRILF